MNHMSNLAHRGGISLDHIQPDQTLIDRIGGRETVERIVNSLYDRIERDTLLRPMFRRNLDEERKKQVDFWAEWFGGAPAYTQHHAYNGLRHRHAELHITREFAQQWLAHLVESLGDAIEDAGQIQEVLEMVRPMAFSFVNESTPPALQKT
jgi:hemoglobin